MKLVKNERVEIRAVLEPYVLDNGLISVFEKLKYLGFRAVAFIEP